MNDAVVKLKAELLLSVSDTVLDDIIYKVINENAKVWNIWDLFVSKLISAYRNKPVNCSLNEQTSRFSKK